MDKKELLERLARIKKDMARTEKKLAKSHRAAKARAHVQRKLREQAYESSSTEDIFSEMTPFHRGDESVQGLVRTPFHRGDESVQSLVNTPFHRGDESVQGLVRTPSHRGDESVQGFVRTFDAEVEQVVNSFEKIQELRSRGDKQENKAESESVWKDLPTRPVKQKCQLSTVTLLQEKVNRKVKTNTSPGVSSVTYEISSNSLERDNQSSWKICKNQSEFTQHVENMNVQSGEITSAPTMMNPETLLHSINYTPAVSVANAKESSRSGSDRPDRYMGKNVQSLSRSSFSSTGEPRNARQTQIVDSVKPCEGFVGSKNDTKLCVTQKSANSQIVGFENNQPVSQISGIDSEVCEQESCRFQNTPPETSCTSEKQAFKYKHRLTVEAARVPHVLGNPTSPHITNQGNGFTLQDQNCFKIINSSPALSASLDHAEIHSSDLIQDSLSSDSQLAFNMGQWTQRDKKKKVSGQMSEPCAKKRQSLRISVLLSSQMSSSQSTTSLELQNSQTSDSFSGYTRKGMQKSKNQLIISSVFQYLVDEGKRKNSVENFSLPDGEFEVLLKQKDSCRQDMAMPVSDIESTNFVQEFDSNEESSIFSCEPETHTVKPNIMAETSDSRRFYAPLQAETLYSSEKTFSNDIFKEPVDKLRWAGSQDRQDVNSQKIITMIKESEFCFPIPKLQMCLESDFNFQSPIHNIGKEAPYVPNMSPYAFDHDVKSALHSTPAVISQLSNLVNSSSRSPPLALSVPYHLTVDSSVGEEIHSHSKSMAHQGSFQIPQTSQVVCFVVGQLDDVTQSGFYLACLSSTCLSMWKMEGDNWINFHLEKISLIRRTGGSSLHILPSTSSILLLMLLCSQDKTDLTLLVYSNENKHHQHHLMTSREKSIKVCPVSDRELIAYYPGKQGSVLTKYTLHAANPGVHSTFQLEVVKGRLTSVITIINLPQAVLGLTCSREVHIWNHVTGSLLVSVDITDICSDETLLYMAIAEQGFVFVPAFSKSRSQQPGSLIVINPTLSTSETLCAYKASLFNSKWLGCADCIQYKEFLVVLENSGKVLIWNLYSGELAAELSDVTCTGLSRLGDYLILAHNNCFHVYMFVQN